MKKNLLYLLRGSLVLAMVLILQGDCSAAQPNEEKTAKLFLVEDLELGIPVQLMKRIPLRGKEVWFSYYHEVQNKWVTLTGKTNEKGEITFKVPAGKSGESFTFVFAMSKADNDKNVIDLEKDIKAVGYRIPPDPEQKSVTLKIDKDRRMQPIEGYIQVWNPFVK